MEEKQAKLVQQFSAHRTPSFIRLLCHRIRQPPRPARQYFHASVDCLEETKDAEEHTLLISKLKPVIENLQFTFNELVESIQIRQDLEVKTEDVCSGRNVLRRTGRPVSRPRSAGWMPGSPPTSPKPP